MPNRAGLLKPVDKAISVMLRAGTLVAPSARVERAHAIEMRCNDYAKRRAVLERCAHARP